MKKSYIVLISIIIVGIIFTGCSSNKASTKKNGDLTIYTSIYPIQFAVEQIAGDTADVQSVYPAGIDAHTYEPTSKDITEIAKSNAFIYLGAGMEGFAESAADALSAEDVALIELGEQESLFHTEVDGEHSSHNEKHADHSHDGHDHGDHDPHIWLDPLRMVQLAELIKDELITLNPDKQKLYETNFANLESQLHELDNAFKQVLTNKENKHILVSHAAYGYWEDRYGLEQISINGLSSSSEPSQKELTKIIEQANEYQLDYLIFEQNTSNRVSKIIQEHIGAEAVTIHNLAVLTEEDVANKEDYLSLMRQNLQTLDTVTK
ncbi:MAG: metal ABC transporter solute-binding protein, Zn/Mn family [Bacillota bacterium]|uniref:Zinc ABC transporter substrate-binding protein n=1 Tax=Virgibacillus salarius TaxID=447199 RepID=A0A941I7G0_9BACI|nr:MULTISPECIES: zinc ABC transporter substrate-binding protein [Bacillaceae]MBR7794464.1 zinc ABC transporter substrate-binding protein [Virgibacillus salarius]NAZ07187.1 zinc ABC transporter solute-binding protein [Agaribacter marinus]WBX78762.1 zinc ABC transporter substrate-binding protein [Virgibacillus salarius]